jgi:hypothetical protein
VGEVNGTADVSDVKPPVMLKSIDVRRSGFRVEVPEHGGRHLIDDEKTCRRDAGALGVCVSKPGLVMSGQYAHGLAGRRSAR